jgi:hypothetical protein
MILYTLSTPADSTSLQRTAANSAGAAKAHERSVGSMLSAYMSGKAGVMVILFQ